MCKLCPLNDFEPLFSAVSFSQINILLDWKFMSNWMRECQALTLGRNIRSIPGLCSSLAENLKRIFFLFSSVWKVIKIHFMCSRMKMKFSSFSRLLAFFTGLNWKKFHLPNNMEQHSIKNSKPRGDLYGRSVVEAKRMCERNNDARHKIETSNKATRCKCPTTKELYKGENCF